jgi:hypothetical protein
MIISNAALLVALARTPSRRTPATDPSEEMIRIWPQCTKIDQRKKENVAEGVEAISSELNEETVTWPSTVAYKPENAGQRAVGLLAGWEA